MLNKLIALQIRIIWALVLRETITRFGKTKVGYIWLLVEPLMHTGMFALLYDFLARRPPVGDSMFLFLLTGFIPFFMFRDICIQTMNAISANKALLEYPLVKHSDVLIARFIHELMLYGFLSFFIALICYLKGLQFIPNDYLLFFEGVLVLVLLGFGFGLVFSTLTILFPFFSSLISWFIRFLYLFSGVMFSVSHLMPQAIEYLQYNPIVHGIELIRSGFYFGFNSQFSTFRYPLIIGLFLILVGYSFEVIFRKQVARK